MKMHKKKKKWTNPLRENESLNNNTTVSYVKLSGIKKKKKKNKYVREGVAPELEDERNNSKTTTSYVKLPASKKKKKNKWVREWVDSRIKDRAIEDINGTTTYVKLSEKKHVFITSKGFSERIHDILDQIRYYFSLNEEKIIDKRITNDDNEFYEYLIIEFLHMGNM